MQKTLYPPIPGSQHIGNKRFLQADMLQYCCSVFLLDINPPLIYIIQPHKKYIFTWRKKNDVQSENSGHHRSGR